MTQNRIISVLGLGYVGLPVAVNFGFKQKVYGFDINQKRIEELKNNFDRTEEVTEEELKKTDVLFTSNIDDLKAANFHIIAVPTPIDVSKNPDLTPMIKASETVAKVLKKGDIVVYESTVYPGVCEEVCLPILEKLSGLKSLKDFTIGYSPERINPGDKEHSFTKLKKVVSGQDEETLEIVSSVYKSVVEAGVHEASNIKTAEAAKVIENIQRDVNIALMNELALLFDQLNIDTHEVIDAASTKWNFIPFRPGLVGGHCIGVDPYYLTFKAQQIGFHPQVILSGRKVNDSVGKFIAEKTIKNLIKANKNVNGANINIMGVTFKENCPDIRNSRVIDIINELKEYNANVRVYDPYASKEEVKEEFGFELSSFDDLKDADAMVFAVAHEKFKELGVEGTCELLNDDAVLVDVKRLFTQESFVDKTVQYWRL